jgi:hypothetical protein
MNGSSSERRERSGKGTRGTRAQLPNGERLERKRKTCLKPFSFTPTLHIFLSSLFLITYPNTTLIKTLASNARRGRMCSGGKGKFAFAALLLYCVVSASASRELQV